MYTSSHTHAHTQDCTSNFPSTLYFLPLLIWINNTTTEINLSFTHVNTYVKVWLSYHLGSGSLSPNNSDKLFFCGASLSWVLTACKQAHLQLREGTLFSDNSDLFYRNYKVPKERFFFQIQCGLPEKSDLQICNGKWDFICFLFAVFITRFNSCEKNKTDIFFLFHRK